MIFSIPLSKLRPVAIFSDGDLHALAVLRLRTYKALAAGKRTFGTKQPTVYTLISDFVQLFPEITRSEVVEKVEEAGLGLDLAVDWDE